MAWPLVRESPLLVAPKTPPLEAMPQQGEKRALEENASVESPKRDRLYPPSFAGGMIGSIAGTKVFLMDPHRR